MRINAFLCLISSMLVSVPVFSSVRLQGEQGRSQRHREQLGGRVRRAHREPRALLSFSQGTKRHEGQLCRCQRRSAEPQRMVKRSWEPPAVGPSQRLSPDIPMTSEACAHTREGKHNLTMDTADICCEEPSTDSRRAAWKLQWYEADDLCNVIS